MQRRRQSLVRMGLQRCREVKGGGGHATGWPRWVGRKEAGQHMQGMGTERREQGTGQEAEVEPWVGASELTSRPGLGRHRWALMTDKPRRARRRPEPLVMVTSALQRARWGWGVRIRTEPMERSRGLWAGSSPGSVAGPGSLLRGPLLSPTLCHFSSSSSIFLKHL